MNPHHSKQHTAVLVIGSLMAIALFIGLVYIVLAASNLSDYAPTTVHGLTTGRIWATAASILAFAGVVSAGLALYKPSVDKKKLLPPTSLTLGLIAAIIGCVNLAAATGGPGSGNGVVGAAAAIVLGLVATGIGGFALFRSRSSEQ